MNNGLVIFLLALGILSSFSLIDVSVSAQNSTTTETSETTTTVSTSTTTVPTSSTEASTSSTEASTTTTTLAPTTMTEATPTTTTTTTTPPTTTSTTEPITTTSTTTTTTTTTAATTSTTTSTMSPPPSVTAFTTNVPDQAVSLQLYVKSISSSAQANESILYYDLFLRTPTTSSAFGNNQNNVNNGDDVPTTTTTTTTTTAAAPSSTPAPYTFSQNKAQALADFSSITGIPTLFLDLAVLVPGSGQSGATSSSSSSTTPGDAVPSPTQFLYVICRDFYIDRRTGYRVTISNASATCNQILLSSVQVQSDLGVLGMSLYSLMNEPDDGDDSKTTSAKQKREEVIALGVAGGALVLFLVIGLFAYRDKYRRDKYYKTFGYDKVIGDDFVTNNNNNNNTTTTAAVSSNDNNNRNSKDNDEGDDSRRNSNSNNHRHNSSSNNIIVNQGRMSTSKTFFRTAANAETSDDSFARNIHQISSDNNKSKNQLYSQHQYRVDADHSAGSPPRSKANYTRDYHDADDDDEDENNNRRSQQQNQNHSGLHQPRTDIMENIKQSLSSENSHNNNNNNNNGKSNNNLHNAKQKEQHQSGEKSHLLS